MNHPAPIHSGENRAIFDEALEYFTPAPMRFNGRDKSGVPEVFELHVAPSACGRRMCISAYRRGRRNERAHLYITESDIVSGCYEDLIPDAVEEIFETVRPVPKGVLITVTCVDDLLGTDHAALRKLLYDRFPEKCFAIRRVDPIRKRTAPMPPFNMQSSTFELLKPAREAENAINLVGAMVPVTHQTEVYRFAEKTGFTVRQVSDCDTFEEFQKMAAAKVNLVVAPMGLNAANEMEERLRIPFYYECATYSIARLDKLYETLADMCGVPLPDMSTYRERSLQKIERAKSVIGDTPIAIDTHADYLPLTFGRALLEYGFNVRLIMENIIFDGDFTDYNWIREHHPEVRIVPSNDAANAVSDDTKGSDFLCLGFNCGYILKAKHVVAQPEMYIDYGYQAIDSMMDDMVRAMETEADLGAIIRESEARPA